MRAWVLSWKGAILVALLGAFSWAGAKAYRQHRDVVLFRAARNALDLRDTAAAWIWLQRLHQAHPDSVEVARMIARFEQQQNSPAELGWRVRVVQLGPAVLEDYLDWARAALRLQDPSSALEALKGVPSGLAKNSPGYHELLAAAAAATGELQLADDHFAEAARLDPWDGRHLLNLASLRLSAIDTNAREEARATLEKAVSNPNTHLFASRLLLNDALTTREAARIAKFRAELLKDSARTLDDQLSCVAGAPDEPRRRAELTEVWAKVRNDPGGALTVAEWMMERGDSAEALRRLQALPAEAQSALSIQMGEADGYTALRDWPALQAFLEKKNWHGCEFMRKALQARCAREMHQGGDDAAWREAIDACNGDASNLLLLARCAAGWHWQEQADALYWKVSRMGYPSRLAALKALWKRYTAAGDTPGLLHVAEEQYQSAPDDPAMRNNYAFLSLLLGVNTASAQKLAAESFHAHPDFVNLAATYAFSLYLQGQYAQSLQVLNTVGAPRLRAAGASIYLALVQRANGLQQAAAETVASIDPRTLLPEERSLLKTAL